jgi:polyferredoxin
VWLLHHQRIIRGVQWVVVAAYLVLVTVPAFLPLPGGHEHIWGSLTLFAQFAFWGIWWPFVIASMLLLGRSWCGLLCPEGMLTEFSSRWSLGRAVPRWLRWGGWPFVAFVLTTVYGQMVSVYQYPRPALLILGGSTLGAVAVGLVYGRNKRVWCRYLCPVNGVFALFAKLAPVAFQVDRDAWAASSRPERGAGVNCAPLVPIRTMRGAGQCHMCGRCQGYRGAVGLAIRSPNHEIVNVAGDETSPWQTALILFGLMGVAVGAFQWSASPWYVIAKQMLAEWLVDHGVTWPLEALAPWWLLTNYPAQNDVLTLLDGFVLLAYIGTIALLLGGTLSLLVACAARAPGDWSWRRCHHFAQTLIPIAACGVFLGLSSNTLTMLRADAIDLPHVQEGRALLLAAATIWSITLAWRVAGSSASGLRRILSTAFIGLAAAVAVANWALLFWIW